MERTMKQKILAILMLLVGIAAGVAAFQFFQQKQAPVAALVYPQPRDLHEFRLTDQDGQTIERQQLRGQWTLAFVGYTFCPDICPLTMAMMAGAYPALAQMLPTGEKLAVWFISADPQRDTASQLKQYVGYFEQPAIKAVTAKHDQLFPFVRDLGLMYAISTSTEPDYKVDHSASIVLLNPAGQLVAAFKPEMAAGQVPVVQKAALLRDFPLVLAQLKH
jgi:protein SCO1/2